MDDDTPSAEPEPDLAQLLVLEAGRIIEDLTPDLAQRLPLGTAEREGAIEMMVRCLTDACNLLAAARVVVASGQSKS